MLTTLQTRLKKAVRWLPVALLPFATQAQAQTLNYSPANAVNVAGTFTDISATGTAIATANTDDANSAAQPIGFTFNFNGTAFTQFVLNTNGLIRLGAAAPSVANLFFTQDFSPTQTAVDPIGSTNAADRNLLIPFNIDLVSGTSPAEYSVATTGTAGSRVCTVQWKNVSDKAGTGTDTAPTQYSNFTFQLKMYEGSNNVEFVYGPATASTGAATSRFPTVGIKGANATSSVLGNKPTGAAAWSTTVFINGPYGTSTHNFRNATLPDVGRTYRFAPTVLLNNDAAVTALYTLGKVSSTYGSPVTAQVVVSNLGSSAQTALPVTLTVSGATTFSSTQTIPTLASGASTTLTFTYPVTGTSGTNTVTAAVTAPDDLATNDSKTTTQTISAADMSYIVGTTFTGGAGVQSAGNVLVARYTANGSAGLNVVTPTFAGVATAGSTYQVVVYSANATTGLPGTVLYTSPSRPRPTAAAGAVVADAVTLPSIPVTNTFFVGVKTIGAENIGLAYQTESPLRSGTFLFTTNGTTFTDLSTSTLPARLAIDVTLGATPTCAVATGLSVSSITATSASLSFTPSATATSYTVTYTAGTTTTTVTPAPTASPVALTGLTPNTTYTVSVVTNCAGGQTSGAVTTTFTTAPAPPPFATLPFSESFEGPWINNLGTRDIPSASWRNTPATGNNSFRRNDDGASATWSLASGGAYTPASSAGTYSARFHTYFSATGTQGTLDLYLNLSAVGIKRLNFDYINPTGADKLEVLLSTDGGNTFAATPLLSLATNTAFSAKQVTIPGNSATTVLRFRATSDFGDDDLGFDNVQVSIVTANRNEALAATVNLYPNPAHRTFQLDVPAGSLHAASATLINALGQVVQQRELNLPATGGTASFDVSKLAAGVYSLQLKTGETLVVKRVVVE
ncbi:Por secretion system C-terminal sorting domain-containing protein [Hymenobacter daecheongensis DSM 21074]|uniref:Por secretion system C-terminal sorting domain-containing protein n=1 Tax=Hymenobacter daecheongensis DSM 21074 TaxID=1121955 RepID=A0A1M6LDH6_9BACT|nr:T9SS type A sorting domain-containing protein [Hymenobacter daecheongensis]SHJ69202.1 Por secretion system C-terminal sorting domain-containing protein [Hymenobacter daecheongensis DSM 21074]